MTDIRLFRLICRFAVILAMFTILENGAAAKIYVPPGESIQDAVDKALPGDTIFVKPGKYNESLEINTDNLTIISSSKNPYDTIITGEKRESNAFKVDASNVTINGFLITESKCGIYLNCAQNCTINNNVISGNNLGISLFKSENNTLSNNIISSNSGYGIKAFTSSDNVIYNNYFNNTNNAWDEKLNVWNRTSGNCWSDYTGKDEDGDGMSDMAYVINRRTKSMDYRPLIDFIPEFPVMPEAIFTSNVTAGYAPLTVEFTDVSENASSRLWNLGNLGTSNSSDFLETFDNEGNYTITLNVTNENGSDSADVIVNVLKVPDPLAPMVPEAKFKANATEGDAPLTVQFFDFSENATSLSWGFGDGKKSCCPAPKHTFCCPGSYRVSLTAENENGSSSTCMVITVLKSANQSSKGDTGKQEDPGSSRRSNSTDTESILKKENLESVENFALTFTGTPLLIEAGTSVEHEMLIGMDMIKNFPENFVSRVELRKHSMQALLFGFLGIALGLSTFERGKK